MRKLLSAIVALSLLGGWTLQVSQSCGGPCCVVETSPMKAAGHAGTMLSAGTACCCCGEESAPCDLEQGDRTDTQPRALSAAPKVPLPEACSALAVQASPFLSKNEPRSATSGADPPLCRAVDPLYLQHLALLC